MNDPQNDMLDSFVKKHPQFGPKPDTTPPVLRTDGERLEVARKALREVMDLSFPTKDPSRYTSVHAALIWKVADAALARTSKAETVDTVP